MCHRISRLYDVENSGVPEGIMFRLEIAHKELDEAKEMLYSIKGLSNENEEAFDKVYNLFFQLNDLLAELENVEN